MDAAIDGADVIIVIQADGDRRGDDFLPAWAVIGHHQLARHHLLDDMFVILLDERCLAIDFQERCRVWFWPIGHVIHSS